MRVSRKRDINRRRLNEGSRKIKMTRIGRDEGEQKKGDEQKVTG